MASINFFSLRDDCEVSGAGLDFVSVFGADFDFAEFAVFGGVGGNVSDAVLAAEFLGNLVEGGLEFFRLIADFNDSAAGFGGEFFHVAIAAVATVAVETAVGAEQNVHDAVGFLSGLDGVFDLVLTALVSAVGKQYH